MQLTPPTLLGSLQHRLDVDATTTNAERDRLRSVDKSLRNFEQRSEAAVTLFQAGEDVYDNYHQLAGGFEPSSIGARALEGVVGASGVALGVGEIRAASEHFKKGENALGALGLASGLASAGSGAIGLAQATVLHQSLNSLPLDKISGVTAGVGSILDGVEDFHEVSKGGEKLVFDVVGGLKVTAGTMEIVGAAMQQPLVQAIGSSIYLGSLLAQYANAPDVLENDLAQHLALYDDLTHKGQ